MTSTDKIAWKVTEQGGYTTDPIDVPSATAPSFFVLRTKPAVSRQRRWDWAVDFHPDDMGAEAPDESIVHGAAPGSASARLCAESAMKVLIADAEATNYGVDEIGMAGALAEQVEVTYTFVISRPVGRQTIEEAVEEHVASVMAPFASPVSVEPVADMTDVLALADEVANVVLPPVAAPPCDVVDGCPDPSVDSIGGEVWYCSGHEAGAASVYEAWRSSPERAARVAEVVVVDAPGGTVDLSDPLGDGKGPLTAPVDHLDAVKRALGDD